MLRQEASGHEGSSRSGNSTRIPGRMRSSRRSADIAQDKLQPDADEPGKMSEEGAQGESGDLAAGLAKDFTLNLSPGKYVLMCNQPGHYMVGMHIAFVVR